MDTLDQLMDRVSVIQQGQEPQHMVIDYIYVICIDGKWTTGTFKGRPTGCNDHIMEKHKVDLRDSDIRWARGHVTDEGTFIIHPRNDAEAQRRLIRWLEAKRRR